MVKENQARIIARVIADDVDFSAEEQIPEYIARNSSVFRMAYNNEIKKSSQKAASNASDKHWTTLEKNQINDVTIAILTEKLNQAGGHIGSGRLKQALIEGSVQHVMLDGYREAHDDSFPLPEHTRINKTTSIVNTDWAWPKVKAAEAFKEECESKKFTAGDQGQEIATKAATIAKAHDIDVAYLLEVGSEQPAGGPPSSSAENKTVVSKEVEAIIPNWGVVEAEAKPNTRSRTREVKKKKVKYIGQIKIFLKLEAVSRASSNGTSRGYYPAAKMVQDHCRSRFWDEALKRAWANGEREASNQQLQSKWDDFTRQCAVRWQIKGKVGVDELPFWLTGQEIEQPFTKALNGLFRDWIEGITNEPGPIPPPPPSREPEPLKAIESLQVTAADAQRWRDLVVPDGVDPSRAVLDGRAVSVAVPLFDLEEAWRSNDYSGGELSLVGGWGWIVVESLAGTSGAEGQGPSAGSGPVRPAWGFQQVELLCGWNEALSAAVQFVENTFPGRLKGKAFRWWVWRSDGKPMSPVLIGDHVGAALALALAAAADCGPYAGLHLRGASVVGAIDAGTGYLKLPCVASSLFRERVGALEPTGDIAEVLCAAGMGWSGSELKRDFPRIAVIESLLDCHETLGALSLVAKYETRSSGHIEFLSGSCPILTHYQDIAVLRQVSRPDSSLPLLMIREPGGKPGSALTLPSDEIEAIVNRSRFTGDTKKRVQWTDIFSDFSKTIFESPAQVNAKLLPHFVLLSVPGGGKSTFLQFLNWLASQPWPRPLTAAAPSVSSGDPTDESSANGLAGFREEPPGPTVTRAQDSGEPQASQRSTMPRQFNPGHRIAVRVALREWEKWTDDNDSRTIATLTSSLAAYLAARHAAKDASSGDFSSVDWNNQWLQWLKCGRLILLLDGLDEVSDICFGEDVLQQATDVWRHHMPVVLTCRTLDDQKYPGKLTNWPFLRLEPFSEGNIKAFIANYPFETAQLDRSRLEFEILGGSNPEVTAMARTPVLLNVICYLKDQDQSIPGTRTGLYSMAVTQLLRRKLVSKRFQCIQLKPNADAAIKKALGILQSLAIYFFMENEGLQPLNNDRFTSLMEELVPNEAERNDYIGWFVDRSGLVRRKELVGYTFLHNQFLEFLAGEGLAVGDGMSADLAEKIRNPANWREVLGYAAVKSVGLGSRGVTDAERRKRLSALLRTMIEGVDPQSVDDRRWRLAILAGEVVDRLMCEVPAWDDEFAAVANAVAERLVGLMELESLPINRRGRAGLAVVERAHAGRVLGLIGDPRPGVAPDAPDQLLDMPFCFVPGEPDTAKRPRQRERSPLADGSSKITYPFWVAQYPVTVAQFRLFATPENYRDSRWWSAALVAEAWNDGTLRLFSDKVTGPHPFLDYPDHEFNVPNAPMVQVSWYEAVAFTAWLDSKIRESMQVPEGWQLRLLHALEWQRAAQGGTLIPPITPGDPNPPPSIQPLKSIATNPAGAGFSMIENPLSNRRFPWGDVSLLDQANWTNMIRRTSAVGCFPTGTSPVSAHEMAGNVREWCGNYHNYNNWRELRGGCWNLVSPEDLACERRYARRPEHRSIDYGFRCGWVGVSAPEGASS